MSEHATEHVITKSVMVARSPEDAFRLFTEGIATWWPLRTHSVAREHAETAVVEGFVGGRIYERTVDGEEILWGTIVAWQPPERLVYTWHPGREADTRQDVEMRFTPGTDGTRVELAHRGWERLGDEAPAAIRDYETGWDFVLGACYVAVAD